MGLINQQLEEDAALGEVVDRFCCQSTAERRPVRWFLLNMLAACVF
jgi:hypothetical protein